MTCDSYMYCIDYRGLHVLAIGGLNNIPFIRTSVLLLSSSIVMGCCTGTTVPLSSWTTKFSGNGS